MTLQDYFPADLTLLGLQNIFSQVEKDSFYVNSNCVVAKGKILTKHKHYIIFDVPSRAGITMTEIVLIDLFFYEGSIHLISENINTHRVSIVSLCLECPETNCTRFLVDLNFFIDRMDTIAIIVYCGCEINKNNPIGEFKHKVNDDLL